MLNRRSYRALPDTIDSIRLPRAKPQAASVASLPDNSDPSDTTYRYVKLQQLSNTVFP